jgi:hypothetical protein
MMDSKENSEPVSAQGDFYVEAGCCAACGVPEAVAPDLIGRTDDRYYFHCYWKKQPETADELQRAFAIFDGQELGCHRYRGHDQEIQLRVGYENCDQRPEGSVLCGTIGPKPGIADDQGMFARLRAKRSQRRRARLKRGW